jgi:beta-glucanase (GH16 family)
MAASVWGQGAWKLVWSDTFEKDGLPDPTKWGYEYGKVRNNEAQFYTRSRRENARVEGGRLIIEGRKEPWEGSEYTSASLISHGHFAFEYGRVEVVAKIPSARGTWPAIWMLGDDHELIGWPKCGEIDIMEHVLQTPGTIYGTVHQGDANGKQVSRGGKTTVPDYATAFHTYSLEWSPTELDFFVDESKYFSYQRVATDPWSFDRPMYLLINLAIGGSWGGVPGIDAAAFPQRYEVKSVKIFFKNGFGRAYRPYGGK